MCSLLISTLYKLWNLQPCLNLIEESWMAVAIFRLSKSPSKDLRIKILGKTGKEIGIFFYLEEVYIAK